MPKMTEIPLQYRPREKLLRQGSEALTDAELLAIFLRTGIKGKNALELSQDILSINGLEGLFDLTLKKLQEEGIKGVGEAKYAQLQAVLTLSKRHLKDKLQRQDMLKVSSFDSVSEYLQREIGDYQEEVFLILFLNNQNHLIKSEILFYGTVNETAVYPRVIIKKALLLNAAAIILCHNHPSGHPEVSTNDIKITQRITQAADLVDIRVLDHIIVAKDTTISFEKEGIMPKVKQEPPIQISDA